MMLLTVLCENCLVLGNFSADLLKRTVVLIYMYVSFTGNPPVSLLQQCTNMLSQVCMNI